MKWNIPFSSTLKIRWGLSASSFFSMMSSNSVKLFRIFLELANTAQRSICFFMQVHEVLTIFLLNQQIISKLYGLPKCSANLLPMSTIFFVYIHNPDLPWTWCSCHLQYDNSLLFQCKNGYLFRYSNTFNGNTVS